MPTFIIIFPPIFSPGMSNANFNSSDLRIFLKRLILPSDSRTISGSLPTGQVGVRQRHFAVLRMRNVSLTNLRTLVIFFLLQILLLFHVHSQVYQRPNFSFSSHETLELESIEVDDSATRVYMSILSRKIGGSFCVDKNTYIRNSLGTEEYKLIESMGVPDCPDVHKFSIVGKKLSFILVFPPISADLKYINIIEECPDACISLRYILLDNQINDLINQAFDLYERRKMEESLAIFEDLMSSYNDNKSPVFGTIYLYMISINYELGQSKEIRRLYDELQQSSIINKEEILEEVRYQELIR